MRLLAEGREAGSSWVQGSGEELGLTLWTTHRSNSWVVGVQRGAV